MKKLLTAFALLMLNCSWLMAQNPIIRDQFTADPTARVFNGVRTGSAWRTTTCSPLRILPIGPIMALSSPKTKCLG